MNRYIAAVLGGILMLGCTPADPVKDEALMQAPQGTGDFFHPGIESGVLYAYITADGGIFVYRRDLDRYGWISIERFRRFVVHAKSQGGYLVYSLEDGDLKKPACERAFRVILDAHMNTQDPVELLPLLRSELAKRSAKS